MGYKLLPQWAKIRKKVAKINCTFCLKKAKTKFHKFFPRSSTTLENTIFIAHFSHNFSLLCNERKKSYYNYLILKQKHAYIQQFQAVFFLNYRFSKKKKIMLCLFCPPNMKNKKTYLCF